MGIKSYEDLEVYQEGYQLVLEVYQLTKDFPKEERYELISQLKRASLSVVLRRIWSWKNCGVQTFSSKLTWIRQRSDSPVKTSKRSRVWTDRKISPTL